MTPRRSSLPSFPRVPVREHGRTGTARRLPVAASAKLPTRVPGQGLHRRNRSAEAGP
jgi:hypothetical protein